MLKYKPSALRSVVFTSLTFLKVLMLNFKQTLLATCVSLVVLNTSAEPLINQTGACPVGVTGAASGSCTNQNQQLGDTTSSVTGDVQAPVTSTQQGVSSTSNASGNTINPNFDNKAQVTQNSTNTTTGTINPTINPNTSSKADGNISTNQNQSSATSGPVTGTNTTTSQNDNRSQVGNTSSNSLSNAASNSGGNNLSNEGVKSTIGASITGSNTSTNHTSSQGGMSASSASGGQGGSAQGGQGGYSSAKGGSSQQGQQQSTDNSGNSSTSSVTNNNVDAANRSVYNSRAIAFAPVIHGQSSAPVGVGNTTVIHRKCGTRLNLIRTPIYAHTIGAFSGVSSFPYAYTETTSPAGQPFTKTETDFGTVLMGHEAYITEKTLGTSSSASFSIGGFGSSGGGQGGSQGSGSLTQSIKQVEIFECIYAIQQVVEVKPVVHPVVEFNQVELEVTRPKQDRN